MVSELEKQESKRQEAKSGEVMHQEKVFHLECGWPLEQALQGSGYSTKSDRIQEALGK